MIGRSRDRQRLVELMGESSVLMKGPRRVGKTTLLKHLAVQPPVGWTLVRVNVEVAKTLDEGIETIKGALQERGLVPGRWKEIAKTVKKLGYGGVEIDLRGLAARDPQARLLGLVSTALGRLGPSGRLGLLLDEVPWWLDRIQKPRAGFGARQGEDEARQTLGLLHGLTTHEGLMARLRVVLTGSVGLRPIARLLDCDEYLAHLEDYELLPLDELAGAALFEANLPDRDLEPDACARAHQLAAGIPEWIVQLAGYVARGETPVRSPDVERAAERFLGSGDISRPFDRERRRHLKLRYGNEDAAVMVKILDVVADRDGPTPVDGLVLVAMSQSAGGMDERCARSLVDRLVGAYFLIHVEEGKDVAFHTPLFKQAWRRYGSEV
jgi:hypothetical protein